MAFIEVIEHEQAEGKLKEVYDDLVKTRGKLAEVHKIQSLNPESIINHMDLYMTIMFGKSPLKRYQREMIAVVVSATNNCAYCQTHHAEALNHYWKDNEKVSKLRKDYELLELSEVDNVLCAFAKALTLNNKIIKEQDFAQSLRDLGLTDKAILDANMIISYFNFVNRMIIGLGVQLENDGGEGYKY
jgi:uncharacterized peroxidase-related enzyme